MKPFLLLHAGYTSCYVGLISKNQIISFSQEDKRFASKNIALRIVEILNKNNLTPQELSFIGVDCGPGPFTSTRVAVATANGIAFGIGLPIVELNSLEALLESYPLTSNTAIVLAVYNAYNQDIYYAIRQADASLSAASCTKQELLINQVIPNILNSNGLTIIGQGVDLILNQLNSLYQNRFITNHSYTEPTIQALANHAIKKFQTTQPVQQANPLYLKAGYNLKI